MKIFALSMILISTAVASYAQAQARVVAPSQKMTCNVSLKNISVDSAPATYDLGTIHAVSTTGALEIDEYIVLSEQESQKDSVWRNFDTKILNMTMKQLRSSSKGQGQKETGPAFSESEIKKMTQLNNALLIHLFSASGKTIKVQTRLIKLIGSANDNSDPIRFETAQYINGTGKEDLGLFFDRFPGKDTNIFSSISCTLK